MPIYWIFIIGAIILAVFSDQIDKKVTVTIGGNDKLMPNSVAIAYHCEKCKNVIIPYGNK